MGTTTLRAELDSICDDFYHQLEILNLDGFFYSKPRSGLFEDLFKNLNIELDLELDIELGSELKKKIRR